MRKARENRLID